MGSEMCIRDRIQRIESLIDSIPFDTQAARAYGLVYAAVVQSGRTQRRRIADLLIASSAIAENLPLFTRNRKSLFRRRHASV